VITVIPYRHVLGGRRAEINVGEDNGNKRGRRNGDRGK
jgi:hypothetical protein